MITVTYKDFEEMKQVAREILGITNDPKQGETPSMPCPAEDIPPEQHAEETQSELAEEPETPKEEAPAEPKTEKSPEPATYKMEDVRAKLAELNKAGKRDVVAKLLGECGAKKLSDVDPSKYGWLMKKAGEA